MKSVAPDHLSIIARRDLRPATDGMPMTPPVMFRADTTGAIEILHPTPEAASQWAARSTIRGLATSAVMARAAEDAVGAAAGFRPVRWTADLSRPVPMQPSVVHVDVLRTGRRLRLVDVALLQEDVVMARARALFLSDDGRIHEGGWDPQRSLAMPPTDLAPDTPEPRLYYSDDTGWSARAADHHDDSRKQVWTLPFAVVEDEEPTAFQLAAGNADLASVVSHWGSQGLAWINADVTLAIARPPRGSQMGVAAWERSTSGGIAVGSALMHDLDGVFGTATVCALWNGHHVVDPAGRD